MFTIDRLTERIKTPCFVYDGEELSANITAFCEAFNRFWGDNTLVGFSVKTAPVARLIEFASDLGCFAEVVSDDEYALSLHAGITENRIVFNGPIKGEDYFNRALDSGAIINIDSQRELRWAVTYAQSTGRQPRVGIRLNFDLENACPGSTLCGTEGPRFGFSVEDGSFERVVCGLRAAGIEPAGIHAHLSSATRSPEVYRAICEAVSTVAVANHLTEISYIDIGGGFYGGGTNRKMYDEYAEVISVSLRKTFDSNKTKLILEPGGSVLATAAYYCGRVIDVKQVRSSIFAVTELTKLALNSTAFSRRSFTCVRPEVSEANVVPSQILCGYTCMEMDRICELEGEPMLKEGELVCIKYAGAYTTSFTPSFFIMRKPRLYLADAMRCEEMTWAEDCLRA